MASSSILVYDPTVRFHASAGGDLARQSAMARSAVTSAGARHRQDDRVLPIAVVFLWP